MNVILFSIIILGAIGLLAGLILYFTAQKFKVYEDPKIDDVEASLPLANCGGCGFPGCRNFAEACVKADNLDSLYCPVGGNDTMVKVAEILGKTVEEKMPLIAVVRCTGSPQFRKTTTEYDGATTCSMESALYGGHTDCQYGCLGHGDCVAVCGFDAIKMNPLTRLPEVNQDKCTACNACVEACPKNIIELRPKGKKDRRIFVSCINQDKGGTAKKACEVACIGCKACQKACKFESITIENFLAYIDPNTCKLCRACVAVCPTHAIWEVNFPARKVKPTAKQKKLPPKKEVVTKEKLVTEKEKINTQPDIDLKKIAKDKKLNQQ